VSTPWNPPHGLPTHPTSIEVSLPPSRYDSTTRLSLPLLSSLFALLRSHLSCSITNLRDSICGKKTPRPTFTSLYHTNIDFSTFFFFEHSSHSSHSPWQHIRAASSAVVASPRSLRTENPRPAVVPNRLQHRLPYYIYMPPTTSASSSGKSTQYPCGVIVPSVIP